MKKPRFSHRLEFVLHRTALAVCTTIPHRWNRSIGRAVGRLAHALAGSKRRLIRANLERAMPELDAADRARVSRECFQHLGANLLETLSAFRFERGGIDAHVDVEGFEHLEAAVAEGRGVVLLTAHFGYWEYAAQWLGHHLDDLRVIYRPANNPLFDRDIVRLRERAGIALIPKSGASIKLMRALRERAVVGLLVDQYVPDENAIRVPFFGLPSNTTPLVAALSLKTGAPVVPIFTFPIAGGRYALRIDAPIAPEGESGEAATAALTERYLACQEQEIRARPELWMWMHRRWRDTPEMPQRAGEPLSVPAGHPSRTTDPPPNPPSGGDGPPTHG